MCGTQSWQDQTGSGKGLGMQQVLPCHAAPDPHKTPPAALKLAWEWCKQARAQRGTAAVLLLLAKAPGALPPAEERAELSLTSGIRDGQGWGRCHL